MVITGAYVLCLTFSQVVWLLLGFFESLSPTPAQAIYVVGQAAGRRASLESLMFAL